MRLNTQKNCLYIFSVFAFVILLLACDNGSQKNIHQSIREPDSAGLLTQEQKNKQFAEKWVSEVWHNKNLDTIQYLVDPDFSLHDPLGTVVNGQKGVQKWIGGWLNSFPDWTIHTMSLVSKGEYIGVYMWVGGTFTKDYVDGDLYIPATQQWKPRGTLDIWRIVDGKIKEAWMSYDDIIFMQNVGFLPPELGPVVNTQYDSTPIAKGKPQLFNSAEISEQEESKNETLVKSFIKCLNDKNTDSLTIFLSEQVKVHSVGQPIAVDYSGAQEFKDFVKSVYTALPNLNITIDMTIPDGNMLVVRWGIQAEFTGMFQSNEGNGSSVQSNGNTLFKIENGKISEIWHTQKRLKLFQDMGILPMPNQ